MKFSRTKRIVILILALVILISSVFIIRSCSAPPKYEDIEARFKQLMEDAYGVNVIVFGEGLPTYERVSDPRDSVSVYNTGETYTDKNGKEQQRKVWYYFALGTEDRVVAFRDSYLDDFAYAYVSHEEMSPEELGELFPAIDGSLAPEGTEFYAEVFRSEDGGDICYLIPFAEKEYDFYYSATDPSDYDYIRTDSEYRTVDEIKEYAETVYSRNYMLSLYSTLFDGIASGDYVMKARYAEYTRADNTALLAQSNTYEPLFTERRVYLFDTARIVKLGSNSKFVRISIKSYLPSQPDKIVEDEVNLVLQAGKWFLDSPTF